MPSWMTNDFNLNKVAEFQGVRVLNINELSNAVKLWFCRERKWWLPSSRPARKQDRALRI